MATNDIDATHQRFMAVAPHVMALAHKIVEAHVPPEKQSMQQAEELYGLIDAAIGKWVQRANSSRDAKESIAGLPRQWTSWFRLRLEGSGSTAKPSP